MVHRFGSRLNRSTKISSGVRAIIGHARRPRQLAGYYSGKRWIVDLFFPCYVPIMNRTCRSFKSAVTGAFIVAATAFATSAAAQPVPEAQVGDALSLPFGVVPREIFDVPCTVEPGNADVAPSLRCEPANILDRPSIAVSVADWKSHPSRAEIIANVREAFHERPMLNVIREENFVPPGDLDAVGFRALYQTDLGNRYVWAVLSRGKMMRVVAFVFAPGDFAAMTADIEWKLFGVPPP